MLRVSPAGHSGITGSMCMHGVCVLPKYSQALGQIHAIHASRPGRRRASSGKSPVSAIRLRCGLYSLASLVRSEYAQNPDCARVPIRCPATTPVGQGRGARPQAETAFPLGG